MSQSEIYNYLKSVKDWVSTKNIKENVGVSLNSVDYSVRKLEKYGFVLVKKGFRGENFWVKINSQNL